MDATEIGQEFVRVVELRLSQGCSEDQIVGILGTHDIKLSLLDRKITITESDWNKFLAVSDSVFPQLNKLQPKHIGQYPPSLSIVADAPVDKELMEMERRAELGDTEAQYSLGAFYGKPDSPTANHEEAVKWYSMAAEGGHAEAHGKIGYRYSIGGYGLPKDDAEAVRWYKKGVELGDAYSQHSLAAMYCGGEGVRQNYDEAARLFRLAANQGFVHSLRCLGIMYYSGEGIPRNHAEAFVYFTKAAKQGDAESQYNLGVMYAAGEGTRKNPTEAAKWQQMATEQGYTPPAQSDREDDIVSVRDRKGRLIGKFPLKEVRAKTAAGSIDQECEMTWASGGPWIVVGDLIPLEKEKRRAEQEINRQSPNDVLRMAARKGDCELIKWLLVNDPNILKQKNDALILAIQGGHATCVRLLVTRGANIFETDVIDAAGERGNATINRYLNPTGDKELATMIESAAINTQQARQSASRLTEIRRKQSALEQQLRQLPKAGNDGIHVPKCPTCGSPDVERISLASKGLAAFTFGLLSIGYAGKSYECHNCRHKW